MSDKLQFVAPSDKLKHVGHRIGGQIYEFNDHK